MRMIMASLSVALAPAALAQSPAPQPSCPATPAKLPAEFASWARPVAVAAGTAAPVPVAVGRAMQVTLRPTAQVRYARPPEKPGAPNGHGGMLALDVARPGTYRVGLSAPAWIDVVRDGKAIASTAHGHGPDCSGIRKLVSFPLQPGRYLIQFAGNPAPQVTAIIVGPG